jgi:hypothetical protein
MNVMYISRWPICKVKYNLCEWEKKNMCIYEQLDDQEHVYVNERQPN